MPRIYELGGELPRNTNDFHDMSACPPAYLRDDPTDIMAILKVPVEAERCAVRGYTNICNLTAGKDHRTYDPSLAILNEEVEHEQSWQKTMVKTALLCILRMKAKFTMSQIAFYGKLEGTRRNMMQGSIAPAPFRTRLMAQTCFRGTP